MKILKQTLAGVVVVLVALAALLFSPSARAQIGDKIKTSVISVLVVNNSSEPVPVAGTVNLENNGDNPLSVRNIDSPAIQPVHFDVLFDVPPGKRLVAEYISAEYTSTAPCDVLVINLLVSGEGGGGSTVRHTYYPRFIGQDDSGLYVYGLSEVIRAYIDGGAAAAVGSASNCSALRNSRSRLTGHLVDIQ
jgi:hypothetical protein